MHSKNPWSLDERHLLINGKGGDDALGPAATTGLILRWILAGSYGELDEQQMCIVSVSQAGMGTLE